MGGGSREINDGRVWLISRKTKINPHLVNMLFSIDGFDRIISDYGDLKKITAQDLYELVDYMDLSYGNRCLDKEFKERFIKKNGSDAFVEFKRRSRVLFKVKKALVNSINFERGASID